MIMEIITLILFVVFMALIVCGVCGVFTPKTKIPELNTIIKNENDEVIKPIFTVTNAEIINTETKPAVKYTIRSLFITKEKHIVGNKFYLYGDIGEYCIGEILTLSGVE